MIVVSQAQLKAKKKYEDATFEKVAMQLRKDSFPRKDDIKLAAAKAGMGFNAFCEKVIIEAAKDVLKKAEKNNIQ